MYGTLHEPYDPTLEDDPPRHVQVNHTCYLVKVQDITQYSGMWSPSLMQIQTPVVVLSYDVSSKQSFENLKKIYDKIPAPVDGKLQFQPDHPSPSPYYHLFVPADQYPVVIIGCRDSEDSPREVEKEDVEAFLGQHPECQYAGECIPKEGMNENVDGILRYVVIVYHELLKQARRKEDLHLEVAKVAQVDIKPPENKQKRKFCAVQ